MKMIAKLRFVYEKPRFVCVFFFHLEILFDLNLNLYTV